MDNNSNNRMAESHTGGNAQTIWLEVRKSLQHNMKGFAFKKWIDRLDLVAEVNGEMLLMAQDDIQARRIESDYIKVINAAWMAHDGKRRRVVVRSRDQIDPDTLALAEEVRSDSDKPRRSAFRADEARRERNTLGARNSLRKQTLDSLVVGQANHLAAGIIQGVVEGGEPPSGIITIYGSHGVGKSHHLQALHNALIQQGRGDEVIYITAQEFLTAYVSGAQKGDTTNLRERVRKARFVLFDDLHVICGKRGTEQEFWETLREVTACNDNGPAGFVFVASEAPPTETAGLSPRIRSELQGGMLVELETPDLAMMREILARKTAQLRAHDSEFELTEDMVERIIYAVDEGPRVLTGILVSIYSETAYANRVVNDEIVDRTIQRHVGRHVVPNVEEIKRAVSEATGISRSVMESESRFAPHCQARHIAFFIARERTPKSLPQIGQIMGGRHHTTVMHGHKKITQLLTSTDAKKEALKEETKRLIDASYAALKEIVAGRPRPMN